ncbi:MAG TPA: hypothetical protein VMF87_21840 [Streptosporangiaceae bacterium]|nr:hypothetical protein [Streptosporangiaceae bacterium]
MSGLLPSLDAPPSGRGRPIWFDATNYGRAKLLAGGAVPWGAPAELTAFFAKLQGMFRSDAVLVDVADLFAQRAVADASLRAAMAARTRPGHALRTLLADEQARTAAAEAVVALAATNAAVPLILAVPTPGRWLDAAAEQALPDSGPAGADRTETAAMYVADVLRTFAGLGVDGLLLDEGRVPAALVQPEAYRSVLNIADHYEWPVLIQTDAAAAWPHGPVPGVFLWIGTAGPGEPSGRWGAATGPGFWAGESPVAEADLVLAVVPAEADPEAVMKQVRALG